MVKIFCDGCYHRDGTLNDLTDRKNEILKMQVTRAQIIDLCPEHCSPIASEFRARLVRLANEAQKQTAERRQKFLDEFWGALKHGSTQTAK